MSRLVWCRMNVSGKMRAVLIDWLIEVHSQFKLLQETLYMTVYVIDKFLQEMITTGFVGK